jgi:hypothetical protein
MFEPDNIEIENAFISIDSADMRATPLPSCRQRDHLEESKIVSEDMLSDKQSGLNCSHPGDNRYLGNSSVRAVTRRERPLSTWLWSDAFYSNITNSSCVDWSFERRILRALANVAPPPPAWKVEGGREYGRVSARSRSTPLLDSGPEVRLRRDRVARSKQSVPDKLRDYPATQSHVSSFELMTIFHESIRAELRNLYGIVSSLDTRIYDLNRDDLQSFFAWLGTFGDFLRLYFASSERFLVSEIEKVSDMELFEEMSRSARKRARLRIVTLLEDIEILERPMEVRLDSCQEFIPRIAELSRKVTSEVLRHLDAEMEQLPAILSCYFHPKQIHGIFMQMTFRMRQSAAGSVLMGILSTEVRKNSGFQTDWLAGNQPLSIIKRFAGRGSTRLARRWTKSFADYHQDHVLGFTAAEAEYRELYLL